MAGEVRQGRRRGEWPHAPMHRDLSAVTRPCPPAAGAARMQPASSVSTVIGRIYAKGIFTMLIGFII